MDEFAALGISAPTLEALRAMGYETPTAVQKEAIPLTMEGCDLVVQSRTGTGKTAAFGIPLVEKVNPEKHEVQALVLTPTRELAVQVRDEMEKLGAGHALKVQAIYGGDSLAGQVEGIRAGAQIAVGTPGRVLDLLKRGDLRLKEAHWFVLDEADKMLDMGFAQEMSEIMSFVPEDRQTFLFSATIPLGIKGLIYNYLTEPRWVLLSEDFAYVTEVRHSYIITPAMQKEAALEKLIELDEPTSSMIFCNTRGEVRSVATYLAHQGLAVAMISSDLTQKKREQVMSRFRSGEIRHLVATDVAARGIDIDELSHVFIYSTPDSPEAYIHRAGRTGRSGRSGDVISLVAAADLVSFNRLANRYHLDLTERSLPTDEEVRSRKVDRVIRRIDAEAGAVDEVELSHLDAVAEALASHPDRTRLIAYLIRRDFGEPVNVDLVAENDIASRAPGRDASEAPKPGRGSETAREGRRPRRRKRSGRRRTPRSESGARES